MLNYRKGKNVEEELSKENIPIDNLPQQFLWMHVKGGTKISNVVDYAKKAFDANEYRSVVWSGSGGGVQKTISCAEIMKRQHEMHQITKICYRKVEEYWEPETEGLEPIVATREIPSIHIYLSLDEIDPKTIGYQHSKHKTQFWLERKNLNIDKKKFNRNDSKQIRTNKKKLKQNEDKLKQNVTVNIMN